jgi:monovalent cation:proton antiporter
MKENREHTTLPESEFTEEQQHRLFYNPDYILHHKKLSNNIIIHTVIRPLVFFIAIFAFYLLWSGHNAPGGGFVAGLMVAAGIVLLYVIRGSSFIQKEITFDFKYLVAIGLLCCISCGLGAFIFGYPFLTQAFGHMRFPILGNVELSTAFIFDFGVFLTVAGSCLTIIISIGKSGDKT